MRKQNYKSIFSFLILGLIVFSTINSFNQPIEETSNELVEEEPDLEDIHTSAVIAGTLDMNTIRFSHIKGTKYSKVSMTFKSVDIQDAYDKESAHMYIVSSIPSGVARSIESGLSSDEQIVYNEFGYNEINDGGYGQSFECYTNEYLTGYSPTYADRYVDNATSGTTTKTIYYTTNQGTSDSSSELIILAWSLYPIISIDSDYYNFGNIRVEVYDKLLENWIEFDPTDIILSHPEYKMRIYDKEINNLIFEDSDFQFFKYHREVSLDTLKIQNNAPEPINATILESNHYKGAYSFDLDEVNTRPDYFNYSSNNMNYVQDEKNDHNKIMYINSNNDSVDHNVEGCFDWGTYSSPDYSDFTDSSGASCGFAVVDEIDFHQNPLNIYDDNAAARFDFTLSVSGTSSGSFEFYILAPDTSKDMAMYFGDSYDASINFKIDDNYFKYYDGIAYYNIKEINDNQWYHIRIDYDFTSDWHLWVDKISQDNGSGYIYRGNPVNFDYIRFLGNTGESGVDFYFDSFGMSWNNYVQYSNLIYTNTTISLNNSEAESAGIFEWWQFNGDNNSNYAIYLDDFQIYNSGILSIQYQNELIYSTSFDFAQWNQFKVKWYDNKIYFWNNENFLCNYSVSPLSISSFQFITFADAEFWIDAIDYNITNPSYIEGQNLQLNSSEDLWCWEANPNWVSGYYGFNESLSDWTDDSGADCTVSFEEEIDAHKNVIQLNDQSNVNECNTNLTISDRITGTIEAYIRTTDVSKRSRILFLQDDSTTGALIYFDTSKIRAYNGAFVDLLSPAINDIWYHIKITFNCSAGTNGLFSVWINGNSVAVDVEMTNNCNEIDTILCRTDGPSTDYTSYLDAIGFSWDGTLQFPYATTLENTTVSPLPMEKYSTQINPYSSVLTNYTQTNHLVNITDLYGNILEYRNLTSSENLITYTPPNVRNCLILLSDQLSNYLNYLNYHIYLNNSALYEQNFYREINEIVNISIYDRFDQYLTSQIYTIQRDDNFINIELTLYSLKILNYLHEATILNITNQLNPLDCVLSENIAVNELISLNVKEGNYSIFYIDDSGSENTLNFTIIESRLFILNSTYHEVHFAYFDMSGLGLDSESARFYINNERRDIGKNWVRGDICQLKVLDYFNTTLYSEIISLVSLTEYNIYLPIFTMLINNNYTESIEISIRRSGIDIEFRQIVSAQGGFSIRLLSNVEYVVDAYFTNGTLADSKTILLNENYEYASFGDYEEIIPATPELVQTETNDWIIAVSIISLTAFIAVVIVILLMRKFNTRTKYEIVNIPSNTYME